MGAQTSLTTKARGLTVVAMSNLVEGRRTKRNYHTRLRTHRLACAIALLTMTVVVLSGCVLSETSYPPSISDLLSPPTVAPPPGRSPRQWLTEAHARFRHLLPDDPEPLLTENLTGEDRPAADVWEHFDRTPTNITRVINNWAGLRESAQSGGRPYQEYDPTLAWAGFDEITLATPDGHEMSGRLGWARSTTGELLEADCIILIPGVYGHNLTLRTRDMAAGLRASGFHVLAMEPRGHGQTSLRHPELPFTFGVLETCDLLAAADWLEEHPHVKETGAMGHSWGANTALLAAWYQDRELGDPDVGPELAKRMPVLPPGRHLQAGVIAVSCIPKFEEVIDMMETPCSVFTSPGINNLQNTVRRRMVDRGSDDESGSLRCLIAFEFSRSVLKYPNGVDDGLRFLRLMPHKGATVGKKLERSRVPTWIVHSGNDPLIPVGDAADLLKGVRNPQVAGFLMAGGGHVGYLPYARQYMFNMVVDFFATHGGAIERSGAHRATPTVASNFR